MSQPHSSYAESRRHLSRNPRRRLVREIPRPVPISSLPMSERPGVHARAITDTHTSSLNLLPQTLTSKKKLHILRHGSLFRTICTSCHSVKSNFTSPISNSLRGTENPHSEYRDIPLEALPRCTETEAKSKAKGSCGGLLRPGVGECRTRYRGRPLERTRPERGYCTSVRILTMLFKFSRSYSAVQSGSAR